MDRLLSKMQTLQFAARKGGKGDGIETYLLIGVVIISLITLGVLLYHQFSKKGKAENYKSIEDIATEFEKTLQDVISFNKSKERYTTFDCDMGKQKMIEHSVEIGKLYKVATESGCKY